MIIAVEHKLLTLAFDHFPLLTIALAINTLLLKTKNNFFSGTVKPSWGDDSRKPLWWPSNLHFVSPKNNRSQHRPKLADLNEIIQSFIDSRAQLASFEEMDIEVCETEEEVGELLEMEVGEERNSRTDQNEEQISELEGICDLIKPVSI